MFKLAAAATSVLVGLGLTAFFPPPPDGDDPPPPKARAKEKDEAKKKEAGPRGDLRQAYDLLRRLRAADGSAGRAEERVHDWTERAARYYRDGLKALADGDDRLAHEYGAIAHDLARAADHAQNAAHLDRRDPDLPPPPDAPGPDERARHDLNRAYDRITEAGKEEPVKGTEFYLKASRDLYSAARRDLEAGRDDRGGELARAAEAMTHVAEHLGHIAEGAPRDHDRPEPKEKAKEKEKERRKAERSKSELPPPLPPG